MFDRATKKVVKQIDPKGSLIATSSLNDSRKLLPLAVVLKVQKGWFWQQTKYRPTQFTLNHLLDGEEIKPVCVEEEFVKYKGTHRSNRSGSVELGGAAVSLNMNGQGISQLHLSIGTLQKEYVDVPTLVNDSKGRKLDLTHSLIQQSQKRNIGFTILTERIFTTCDCSISSKELEKGGFHAMFGTGCVEMYMEDTGKLQYDSETVLQIPPNTVMAYSVIEMTIDSDGYFDLWLEPCGLEADDISQNPFPNLSEVDGQQPLIQEGVSLDTLKNALADVQTSFCALAILSAETRSSILLLLRKILLDRSVLSALVERIVMLSSDDTPCFLTNELSEKQSQIEPFLDLLMREPLDKNGLSTSDGCQISTDNQNGCHNAVSNQNACSTKASKHSKEFMNAMQMLISALEEMTDAGQNLLEQFCTSEGLRSLQDLVIHLTSNTDTIPVFLQSDDEFHRVEALFKSCNVLLKKEKDTLASEMTCSEGFLPVVLCIAIHGLASLSGA
ncbi:gasdermin-E [Chanodichthys erythropterus]|uniref:gasdermin-E n=1 Tax=Chanodichthys erythropterus TaxID=933992 RepID=UPI00351EF951